MFLPIRNTELLMGDCFADEVNHSDMPPQHAQEESHTGCSSLFRCVGQIDTDLSEMSVHLLGIHAVLPSDCVLSNCQTSLKGVNHRHTLHVTSLVYMTASKEYIPAYIPYFDTFFLCQV